MIHELSLWIVRVKAPNPKRRLRTFHVMAYTRIEAIATVIERCPDLRGRHCETEHIEPGVIEL